MQKELKKQLLEKYKERFLYLKDINSEERPLPQQTIYHVLEPFIKELVETANVKPYKELLIRIQREYLDPFGINYKELKYNNFYTFLKKRGILNKKKDNQKSQNYEYKKEEKTSEKNNKSKNTGLLKRKDLVDSLTDI